MKLTKKQEEKVRQQAWENLVALHTHRKLMESGKSWEMTDVEAQRIITALELRNQEATDEAIRRVGSNARQVLKEKFYEAGLECARENPDFLCEDVFDYCPEGFNFHDNRAAAGVMDKLYNDGITEPWLLDDGEGGTVQKTRPSKNRKHHQGDKKVWRSLVYQGEDTEGYWD